MLILLFQVEICLAFLTNTVLSEDSSLNLYSNIGVNFKDKHFQSTENIDYYDNSVSFAQNEEVFCNETQTCRNGGSCLNHACLCLPGTSGPLCEIIDDCQGAQHICGKHEDTSCVYSVQEQKAYCRCRIFENRFDDATKTCRSCLCTPTFSQDLSSFSYCEYKQGQQVCTCTEGYAYNPHEEICDSCYCGLNSKWCEFNGKGKKFCVCEEGYAEVYDSCQECDCGKHGNCSFITVTYKVCECDAGYEEVNQKCVECRCGKYGKCLNDANGKQTGCECLPGYAEKMGTCEMCRCGEGSNCSFSGKTKACECQDGFENVNGFCTDINECEKHNPCNVSTRCVNSLGTYKCICDKGYKWNNDTFLCEDIDECELSSTCSHPYMECINTIGSFRCLCESNFVTRGGSNSDTLCEPSESKQIYTVSIVVSIVAFALASGVVLHQIFFLRRRNAVS